MMLFPRLALVSTLIGTAVAQFQILSPGGPNLWWGEVSLVTLPLRQLIIA